jgi:hypothetical protein
MKAIQYWKTVVRDRVDLLGKILSLLDARAVRYCVVDGQAVNAYAEPVVSLDLDIVIAAEQFDEIMSILRDEFQVQEFEHSVNVTMYGSDLRVQIQKDPRYADFPSRAEVREILGLRLPVASLTDVLQGKIWAAMDEMRRPSKRQKDLADIARLLEAHPHLRSSISQEVLAKLV